jgi:hypothetical protein
MTDPVPDKVVDTVPWPVGDPRQIPGRGKPDRGMFGPEGHLACLWAIAARTKANMPADVTSGHGWLYDEVTGLPK